MPIVSSTILDDKVQEDGRRQIIERHVDHVGVETHISYMAEAGEDVSAMLPIRAAQLEAEATRLELAANEEEIIGGNL